MRLASFSTSFRIVKCARSWAKLSEFRNRMQDLGNRFTSVGRGGGVKMLLPMLVFSRLPDEQYDDLMAWELAILRLQL